MKLADALQMVALTDPGRSRSHNEDAVFADAALGIAVLADGMGGYSAGEVASGMATTVLASNFAQYMPTHEVGNGPASGVAEAMERIAHEVSVANLAIYNAAKGQPHYAGMATTLVIAWFYDNRMVVGHIGDSRLYLQRGNAFEQLTRDHSLLQEQLDSGMISVEEARHSQNKNLVTRGLVVVQAAICGDGYCAQFSTRNPLTRPKSLVLLVTTVAPMALACAAIIRSAAPSWAPRFFRSRRISA